MVCLEKKSIENCILNKNISNKSKGIYALLLLLAKQGSECSISNIRSYTKDGIGSVRSSLSELELNGYISRKQDRTNGRFSSILYTVYETK